MLKEYRIFYIFARGITFSLRNVKVKVYNVYMDILVSGKELSIDWDWVRQELIKKEKIGFFDKKASSKIIHSCTESCLKKAKELSHPAAYSLKLRVNSIIRNKIKLEKGFILTGRWLAQLLKGAKDVRLFLVTIGDGIEHAATSMMHKGERLEGYILDRIGSFAVESLAEDAENLLRKRYEAKGKSVSVRVSPGYCDWPIEEQEIMCRAMDFSRIGVSLTKSFMMVPKKSISGLVGIGPKGHFLNTGSPCSRCKTSGCSYRR